MKLDVYNCEDCARVFAVEAGSDPYGGCSACGSQLFEFSHEVKAVHINQEKD